MFFILPHILKHKSDILLTLLFILFYSCASWWTNCGQREHSRPKREKQGCMAQKGCNTEREADDAYPRRRLWPETGATRRAKERLLEGGDSVTVTLAGV